MNSALYEYRKRSARRGATMGMPTVCWKAFPANTTKILSTRNSEHLDDVNCRVLVFRIKVLFHKICFFVPLYQIFVSTVTVFEK